MTADNPHRILEQRVTGGVSLGVVDRLEADDIDIGNRQRDVHPAGPLDLVVEVRETRRASAGTGQCIHLGDRQLAQQGFPVLLCFASIARRLLAIPRRLSPIRRGPGPSLGVVAAPRVTIQNGGGTIAGLRREIASMGGGVTGGGRLAPLAVGLTPLMGAAVASVARSIMDFRISSIGEIAIAGQLVAVGGNLVAVGGDLVDIGS
jgi:hypothetical protein